MLIPGLLEVAHFRNGPPVHNLTAWDTDSDLYSELELPIPTNSFTAPSLQGRNRGQIPYPEHAHGADAAAHPLGDRFVRQPFEVTQHDHCTVVVGQTGQL